MSSEEIVTSAYTLVSIAIILLLGFFQLLLLLWCLCEGKRTRLRAREKKTETQRERFNLKEIIEDALRRDQVILLRVASKLRNKESEVVSEREEDREETERVRELNV